MVDAATQSRPNFKAAYTNELQDRLGVRLRNQLPAVAPDEIGAAEIFHWIYAVVHSPGYRQQYGVPLRVDFARVPWPQDVDHMRRVGQLGRQLSVAHRSVGEAALNMPHRESTAGTLSAAPRATHRPAGREPMGEHSPAGRNAHLSPARRTAEVRASVAAEVWQYQVGGYAVLPRWLKQRRRRTLGSADTACLQRVITVIEQTIAVTGRIDETLGTIG